MPPKLPDSMPWQIYQAYLSGPSALFRLFENAFSRQTLYGEPEPNQQQREIEALSEHITGLKAQVEKLEAEIRLKDSVLSNNYSSPAITGRLLPKTADQQDRGATKADFRELQNIVARDVPVIPIWQGKQYAVAREGISGLEWTLDSSTVFRFWEISKPAEA